MFSQADSKAEIAVSEFRRLLTESAERRYCGSIGVEVSLHMGEIRTIRLPQNIHVPLPAQINEQNSKLRAV